MKVSYISSNGSQKVYTYDRRKYYKPAPKKQPKHKRIPGQVQEYIIKLHKLKIGPSRIAQFVNSMNTVEGFYVGEHTVANFLTDYKESTQSV